MCPRMSEEAVSEARRCVVGLMMEVEPRVEFLVDLEAVDRL